MWCPFTANTTARERVHTIPTYSYLWYSQSDYNRLQVSHKTRPWALLLSGPEPGKSMGVHPCQVDARGIGPGSRQLRNARSIFVEAEGLEVLPTLGQGTD